MQGRKPHPVSLIKSNQKNARLTKEQIAKREKAEIHVPVSSLTAPEHLSKESKQEWNKLITLYKELDDPVIGDLDLNTLELYCDAVVSYRQSTKQIKKQGEVFESDKGMMRNPWTLIQKDARDAISKLGAILLLDPVSRARAGLAKAKAEEEEDPMCKVLQMGRPK